jgi:tRNA pseudouridine32 synthase/23S rRNA pseudouridine746 synthase
MSAEESNKKKKVSSPCTLVELEPLTGRTHQLRVHLSSIGHPVLGDTLYGTKEIVDMSNRLCLHASSISFQHPHTLQYMTIKSDDCSFLN